MINIDEIEARAREATHNRTTSVDWTELARDAVSLCAEVRRLRGERDVTAFYTGAARERERIAGWLEIEAGYGLTTKKGDMLYLAGRIKDGSYVEDVDGKGQCSDCGAVILGAHGHCQSGDY